MTLICKLMRSIRPTLSLTCQQPSPTPILLRVAVIVTYVGASFSRSNELNVIIMFYCFLIVRSFTFWRPCCHRRTWLCSHWYCFRFLGLAWMPKEHYMRTFNTDISFILFRSWWLFFLYHFSVFNSVIWAMRRDLYLYFDRYFHWFTAFLEISFVNEIFENALVEKLIK